MTGQALPETTSHARSAVWRENQWWLFCLAIVLIKLALLMCDPLPKLFLGDSDSYVTTALTGWIPDGRSYWYGYVIRWVALSVESLSPLLLLQTLLSAVVAVGVTVIAIAVLQVSRAISYAMGIACSVDPLQVVWERYLMAETISLFFYAGLLTCSFFYLRDRKFSQLAVVQLFGLAAIGFRTSYLLVIQLSAAVLPFLAFLSEIFPMMTSRTPWARRISLAKTVGLHVIVSLGVMWPLHWAYKAVNGRLLRTAPTYLLGTGSHVLAGLAPIIEPEDAADPRLAEIIRRGEEFSIKDMRLRNNQQHSPGFLLDRWRKVEPDLTRSNEIAKETAINALQRNPLLVMGLTLRTFRAYWGRSNLLDYQRLDLGHVDVSEGSVKVYADRFHFAPDRKIHFAPWTVMQRYFVNAWPYCYVVLLSPVLGLFAVFIARDKRYALLVLIHMLILLGGTLAFTSAPSVRYLQPVSVLTLIAVAVCLTRLPARPSLRPALR